jgi:general secretion pathway protein K
MRTFPQRQRGVALLVALLVVALAVILIAALLDRGELALARTRNVLRTEQAEAYAQGLEIYAAQILLATQGQGQGTDTNASPWAQPLPPQPVPGGMIGATMRDMNGCFNLNNLAPNALHQTVWRDTFERLLNVRGIVDPTLAKEVQDWLDVSTQSAIDNYYLAQSIPYRAAHNNFAHVSELRLVRGFDGGTYAKIAPYVCALPIDTKINVNTASVPVLQSLGISQPIAEKLWNNGQANFNDPGTFTSQASDINLSVKSAALDMLDVKSSYFLARGDIQLDGVPFTFHSLIHKEDGGGIQVIGRSRGSDDALTSAVVIDADHDDTLR